MHDHHEEEYTHSHEHVHADGTTHSHEHTHEHADHGHAHPHTHEHTHGEHSAEEALALLRYMADHNRHHAEELHELAHSLSGDAAELIHAAVDLFEQGNEKLDQALGLLHKED